LTGCYSINEYTALGKPLLLRIDNGWDMPTLCSRFDPLITNPTPWFKDIQEIQNGAGVQRILKDSRIVHEETLFQIFQPFFEDGLRGFFGWRKVIVTRHRFHLWLRWSDQRRVFVE
jgi:hypothetical protein